MKKDFRASGLLVSLLLVPPAVADWQLQRLMAPTPAQLLAENAGHVEIYEDLEAGTVGDAMDQHFERIQNMMFVRIHHLPPPGAGGAAHVEDDGCE